MRIIELARQAYKGSIPLVAPMRRYYLVAGAVLASVTLMLFFGVRGRVDAQADGPQMLDRHLDVRAVVTGLNVPTTMAFIGRQDILVLEKNSGQVKRIVNGVLDTIVLDLAVNFGSERGLLGIALHPDFPTNPGVYLFWTQSSTGADTNVLSQTPLLGNRVDRYEWDGMNLTLDQNLIMIRALQQDAGQPARGNHDGGVIAFGPDEKLYIFIGDLGRRGQLQNLPCGPTTACPGPPVQDDLFGGPEPDNEHLSGVVLRLNDDGTAPTDNPFFGVGASMGGEVGANIQKIFSYGHRNSFGMAFNPDDGTLWLQENGDDSFSEINRVLPGMNGGWIRIMGPSERIAQFKEIETTFGAIPNLQQIRWPPANIADTESEALARLFMLPGSHYSDPEFSWKWEVAPGGIGFVEGNGLGGKFRGDLFVGAATPLLEGGYLFRFRLTGGGKKLASGKGLNDRVADNLAKHDITESEDLLIGRGFGVATDIETGPNGNLFVVSLSQGAIYEIFERRR